MKNFDWEEFKKGNVAVCCDTEEEYENFVNAFKEKKINKAWNLYWDGEHIYMYDESTNLVYVSEHVPNLKNLSNNLIKWKTEFTKSDLEDWMIVELRNGRKYFVNLKCNQLLNMKENELWSWDSLTNYTKDLKNFEISDFDIVKIYECLNTDISLYNSIHNNDLDLIWERKEPKQMTKAEIEKELGYEIEIVEQKGRMRNEFRN